MSEPLTVVARVRAKQGCEDRLRAVLQSLVAPTRAESGCINYDLHQSATDPRDFLFHENWESKDHLDAHMKSDHFKAAFAVLPELLDGNAEITTWNRVP
jgi:quinol monooxygenase YgiN